jgi:MFS family permease
MTLLSLIGRLGMGQLADVWEKQRVMAISFAVVGISLLLFATVHEPWQMLYALPVFAFGFGGIIPVRPAFQAEYFGLKAFGAIQGIVFTIAMLGSLAGPVFAGYVYDETESYRLAFIVLAAAALLAVPLILGARKPAWGDA